MFSGAGAVARFSPEAGGHRYQRVPPTEKRGRRQSSTVTVAVLPMRSAEQLQIRSQDITVETYKDSGPGGQHRNKTESAIRITHIPTGVQACAATKSQHRNRDLAMALLRARLHEHAETRRLTEQNGQRRGQIGSGQRSDKIRTVAEQRGRVENHRTGRRLSIDRYMRGYVEEIQ